MGCSIKFWFEETTPKQYWTKDDKFDDTIRNRFASLHNKATEGKLEHWRETALGALAEIIILDQFSRNLYRGKPESFASDELCLKLAKDAIENGHMFEGDIALNKKQAKVHYGVMNV